MLSHFQLVNAAKVAGQRLYLDQPVSLQISPHHRRLAKKFLFAGRNTLLRNARISRTSTMLGCFIHRSPRRQSGLSGAWTAFHFSSHPRRKVHLLAVESDRLAFNASTASCQKIQNQFSHSG